MIEPNIPSHTAASRSIWLNAANPFLAATSRAFICEARAGVLPLTAQNHEHQFRGRVDALRKEEVVESTQPGLI